MTRDATTDTCGWSGEHLADASLDRRRDGDVSRLLEVRVVEAAVGGDTVEIEQFAAELVADLSECWRELVPAERWRADDKHVRGAPARTGLGDACDLDQPARVQAAVVGLQSVNGATSGASRAAVAAYNRHVTRIRTLGIAVERERRRLEATLG